MTHFYPTPKQCDACGNWFAKATSTEMFDTSPGLNPLGPWGCICRDCFNLSHGRLGLGLGQRYERQDDGKFLLVEGGSQVDPTPSLRKLMIHPLLRGEMK